MFLIAASAVLWLLGDGAWSLRRSNRLTFDRAAA